MENNIKYGDKFQLGEHRLACGRAEDPEILKKLIGTDKVKVICCDVPYGIAVTESKQGFTGTKHKVIANDQIQSDESYAAFTKGWLETIKPYLAAKNSCYIFNSDKMIFALREGMLQAGFKFSQLIIWVKSHAVVGRLNYLPQHELIAFGWFGTHEFRKSQDKSVLFYPRPSKSKLHPTMKPIPLLRNLILNSSRVGDIIYDGFLGSGSCIIAAESVKRKCYGVELDPEYCQVIIDRFEKVYGVKAVKIEEGEVYA
jgi:site-specific DNA-methyltransferase (adenine-specific)